MQLEDIITALAANTAATEANTAAIREFLAAGIPSNVIPITETPKAAAAPKGKAKATTPDVVTEPEQGFVDRPDADPAQEAPEETERPTKVAVDAPKETEFSDPLDKDTTVVVQGSAPALDPEAIIVQITDTWKTMLTAADAERKNLLKDKFPELRVKWGLAMGAKLATLADRPENLVGLLEDIKALQ